MTLIELTTHIFRKWIPGAEEAIKECFEFTDWSVLQDTYGEDLIGVTHCKTDYLNFCMEVVIPARTVRCFPNSNAWVTSEFKNPLNKKRAFKEGDLPDLRHVLSSKSI